MPDYKAGSLIKQSPPGHSIQAGIVLCGSYHELYKKTQWGDEPLRGASEDRQPQASSMKPLDSTSRRE